MKGESGVEPRWQWLWLATENSACSGEGVGRVVAVFEQISVLMNMTTFDWVVATVELPRR